MDVSETQLHGSLVEVHRIGVLLLGPSGVGKSECVIELVRRGHRMVADDVVRLRREERREERRKDGRAESTESAPRLIGWSPETIRHFIEIRGLGLLSVADLFGPGAILDECEVGFVCRLQEWSPDESFERIGLERPRECFLGVDLPTARLPVHAASSLATLVELAARDWSRRLSGVNAARRLDERLRARSGMIVGSEILEGETG
ncbi:MAG TPA: hypothetical protein VKA74_09630 [Myxococcota bacterium]|nr:hypothetical protein [Myxococcota bacterium]